jgi:type I restriction enzyme, S subunit
VGTPDSRLPEGWRRVTVDEIKAPGKGMVVSGPFGSSIGKRFFVGEGIPVIRGNNLTLGEKRFVDEGFVFITKEKAEELRNCQAIPGDLVFTAAGTLGQIGLIPPNSRFPVYVVSNKQLRLRCNPEVALSDYLYYWFSLPDMRAHVANQNTGASIPLITLGTLRSLPVNLPPLPTQRKIAAILSAYDDLIEVNTRRIAILEEMARGLYREWFVRFRFPGHESVRMVESAVGLVPAGWEVATIRDVTTYVNRGVSPKYDDESPDLVVNQKCIRDGRLNLELARRHSTRVPSDKLIRFGDVLINSTGIGTLGRIAQVYEDLPNCTVDSHVSIVRPAAQINIDYFGAYVTTLERHFDSLGTGSTGQTELSRESIAKTAIVLPPRVLQGEYGGTVSPMRKAVVLLHAKNANLRRTRDLLLPRLVAGEVEVGDGLA